VTSTSRELAPQVAKSLAAMQRSNHETLSRRDYRDHAAISVTQREFAEKTRLAPSQNQVRRKYREVLGQNVSRANLEKTIQIARRFAAVRTNTLRMAIDPEFASFTAESSGGQDNQVFLHAEPQVLSQGTCFPTLHGHVDQGSSRRARRCPTRND
jgi:hypothetical protein